MFDAIERAVSKLTDHGAWNDGWRAVRGIIRYDSKGFDDNVRARVIAMETHLKPTSLLDKAEAHLTSNQWAILDVADDYDNNESASLAFEKAERSAFEIGRSVAGESAILEELLTKLVTGNNTRLHSFGRGLATGCEDTRRMFDDLRSALELVTPTRRNLSSICGFLSEVAVTNSTLYNAVLDEAVHDGTLGASFPVIQCTSRIDQRGIQRLRLALTLEITPIDAFQCLAWGRAHESIGDDDLSSLVELIVCKDGGLPVAVEILKMRVHREKSEERHHSTSLIATAHKVLASYPLDLRGRRDDSNADHALSCIASVFLRSDDGAECAAVIVKELATAIKTHKTSVFSHEHLLNSLAKAQPRIFLDEFFGRENLEQMRHRRLFSGDFQAGGNPMNQITDDVLIDWCESDPQRRYAIVSGSLEAYIKSKDSDDFEWRPTVYKILERTHDPETTLDQLVRSLEPMSYSGSLADNLVELSRLLPKLFGVVSESRRRHHVSHLCGRSKVSDTLSGATRTGPRGVAMSAI